MILSFLRKRKNTKQNAGAAEQKIADAIKAFKENPNAWDEKLMGNENLAQEKILNRLLFSISNTENKRKLKLRRFATLSAAAVLVAGLAVGFLFKDELLDQLITYPQLVVETKSNEHEIVKLPDGSVVILNAGTKLSYPQQFSRKKREVTLLEGEAYFDIKHDDKKPFQVKAGKTLTHVLGTAFNISSYSWLQTINVTVTRGKVAVNNEMLLPNQQMVYNKVSEKLEKKKLLASNVTTWMQGRLSFNDDSFKTVAAILERKYQVSISFADKKMEDFHFSATFEPTDKLTDILDALTLTRGLIYETNHHKIIIKN